MRQETPSVIRDYDKPKNHHGFVYVRAGRDCRVPLWEMRKPTPDERLSIISNWIRMHGKEGPIKVSFFSEKLGVSDRTVQSILRLLEENNAITTEPVVDANGKQQGNLYHWTGNVDPVIGGPTMEMLYKRYDSYGFRSFTWDDYKMKTDPSGNLTCEDYDHYAELMDEKRKLKRKKAKTYKSHLKKLKKLHVRSEDDEPI
jgi:DNA-binding transcriptional ArsR family regulator